MGNTVKHSPIGSTVTSTRFLCFLVLNLFSLCTERAFAAVDAHPSRCGFAAEQTQHALEELRAGRISGLQRPDLPEFYEDADTTFRIHYARTGANAVPPADADGSGVPDYVEEAMRALQSALKTYVDTMHFLPPPPDLMEGGSNAVDVYLLDLSKEGTNGAGLYGTSIPETIIYSGEPQRFSSYILVDNNFSHDDKNIYGIKVYSTYGFEGLRITCAHELHHTIQIGSYGNPRVQLMINEMTSVWMEIRTHPESNDWATYITDLLAQPYLWPFSEPSSTNGYTWGWFGNTWHQRAGDNVIRYVWEHIKDGDKPFQAVINATAQAGFGFSQSFCDDIKTLYYTGSRGANNQTIQFADSLPEISLSVDEALKPPASVATGELRPFEVRVLRYTVPAIASTELPISAALIITWPETNALVQGDISARKDYTVTLTTTPTDGAVPIAGTLWYFIISPADICYSLEGASTARTTSPYPQPLHLSESDIVYVPVTDALPGDIADITLMNMQTIGLARIKCNVILDDTRIVALFEVPSNLAPATYLLHVSVNGKESLHKLAVER